MRLSDQELQRRRPVWDALSNLFLDTELDGAARQYIAKAIVSSGYSPPEIQNILWNELYPILSANLCGIIGEWAGFELDWIQEQILAGKYRRKLGMNFASILPFSPETIVRSSWKELLPHLPDNFEPTSK